MRFRMMVTLATGLSLSAASPAPQPSPTRGYLPVAVQPDLVRILPPPPPAGSPRAKADAEAFRLSRAMIGSARWRQATADVTGDMYDHFACALGTRLDAARTPQLTRLLARAGEDRAVVSIAKTHWNTRRPYLEQPGEICEPATAHLAGNPDYPSGHAAHGQHVAMILAALAPSRSTALLARGREFGESRHICGSHSVSAAEAGLLAGAAIFAVEQGQAEFRRDMERARSEVAAALARPRLPSSCN